MRQVRCYPDCPAQDTGDGADCTCSERDDAAYEREMEARVDRARDREFDR